MEDMLKIFATLLLATLIFHASLSYMESNIEDFEAVPLPPKKIQKITTLNPVIQVDAKSKENWTLVDFGTGKTYRIAEPEREKKKLRKISWDLGFQRTKIISNSGATNPQGRVKIANLGPIDFDQVRQVPDSGYELDSRSFGNIVNKAISDWYNYRTRTHNIESKKNVYVVQTTGGRFMKMRFLNYYCSSKEEACRSVLCRREEAACLTIEYLISPDGGRTFPNPPQTQTLKTASQETN